MIPYTEKPGDDFGVMNFVLRALYATGRLTGPQPEASDPPYATRNNLLGLYIDERPNGWVANITFKHVPPGMPNCVGTPERTPFPDRRTAFLAGAALVCEIATGSRELPFLIVGDRLVYTAYRA